MSAVAVEAPLDVSALWRAARFPAVLVVIGLVLVTILAAIGKASNQVPLDPRNTTPNGTHALAALLGDRGITVTIATEVSQLDSSSNATIVVARPAELPDRALRAIAATSATVLLVDPLQTALSAFDINASPDDQTLGSTLEPNCRLAAATVAGSAFISGDLYTVPRDATGCYPQGEDAALIDTTRADGARTIAIGSAVTVTNAQLATAGDAALALGLLDTPLVQWVPGNLNAGPPPPSQRGLVNLLPSRLLWATLQLFIALVVLALWRARRLGRPVVEPLPVVVRAAETVEGRARLLHAAHARGTAARSLRLAAVRRLSHLLRLGPDEDPASVAALVAERTHQPAAEVTTLLYGGEPADDASLVRLAQQLPRLETSIHGDDGKSQEDSSE
jgi:hypothetical protein